MYGRVIELLSSPQNLSHFPWHAPGKSVVERLSQDLKAEFSHKTGFSPQNLWYMRQFYLEYHNKPNLQRLVGEIPWGQNLLILSKVKEVMSVKCCKFEMTEVG
jgi:predicted nuclease of restriction endonuclease-like (RecB) superfamily